MVRSLVVTLLVLSVIGCASGTQLLRTIDPGMTPGQVEQIMGRRDGFSFTERDGHQYTLYQYINRFCNANVSLAEKCDFFIIFRDDKVIETGVKDIRSDSPNMHFLYIFKQP